MGRKLKRVSLDFDWPVGDGWKGYLPDSIPKSQRTWNVCRECIGNKDNTKCREEADYCLYAHKDQWYYDPPSGVGYQLWETTSEGSPITPVFKTLDELCEYAETHCTVFGREKVSKDKWKEMLDTNFVSHTVDNVTFI